MKVRNLKHRSFVSAWVKFNSKRQHQIKVILPRSFQWSKRQIALRY